MIKSIGFKAYLLCPLNTSYSFMQGTYVRVLLRIVSHPNLVSASHSIWSLLLTAFGLCFSQHFVSASHSILSLLLTAFYASFCVWCDAI